MMGSRTTGASLMAMASLTAIACLAQAKPQRKPNLSLSAYRFCYTTAEKAELRISTFNVGTVALHAFRLPLGRAAACMQGNRARNLKELDTATLTTACRWQAVNKHPYPDQWEEMTSRVPELPAGVYVIEAAGAGATARSLMFRTNYCLTTKRSLSRLLVYATDTVTGRPAPGMALTLYSGGAEISRAVTGESGLWQGPVPRTGTYALTGLLGGHPAYVASGPPSAPPPHTVYTYTDRPIYRPGHTVQFKSVIRTRVEAPNEPGGMRYDPYAGKRVVIEVRDPTDALIQSTDLTTNAHGAVRGSLQLAAEPALGQWQIVARFGEERSYARFSVQAYRKPEFTVQVTAPQPHYVGGATIPVAISARYLFGQPVVGASVRYTVAFAGSDDGKEEPGYEGEGITDATGKVLLQVKTRRGLANRQISVRATVADLSRRTQVGAAEIQVTGGAFEIAVAPDRMVYHPGNTALVSVTATDYDGKPVAARVKVRLVETMLDEKRRPYKRTDTREVVTDARGKAVARFAPPRPGYLAVEAEAFDAEDNKITASTNLWVAGPECIGVEYPNLELVADRDSYKPGEVATLILNSSLVTPPSESTRANPGHREAWALVTVEGDELYSARVLHLTSRTTTLQVPLSARHYPGIQVCVTVVQDKHLVNQQAALEVPLPDRQLTVTVRSDHEKYQPGQRATYTIETRDHHGKPVAGEASLGVVDAAIYAIAADAAPDMVETFYPAQEARISTDFSFAGQYSGGAYQAVAHKAASRYGQAAGETAIRVRRNFADTAFWDPFVETSSDGTATVAVDLPDNLTTWRATTRAISPSTSVGSATCEAVSAMPLMVRLELPRFWVSGDQATVAAIIHNATDVDRALQVSAETTGVVLTGDPRRTVTVPASGQARMEWQATPGTGPTARVLVTADGGPGASDATETTLPVFPAGVKMVEAQAGDLRDAETVVRIPVAQLPAGSSMTLTMAPSLASALYDALDYLTTFPYGCAEQTTSSFLPNVIATRAFQHLSPSARKPVPDLPHWVNLGLQKLYRYQHGDGGWNWWEFDQTDGDNTAYVLSGLVAASQAGILVDGHRVARAAACMARLFTQERDPVRRADWLPILAAVAPQEARKAVDDLLAHRDRLDHHGHASLLLALATLKLAPQAATLASELEAAATVRGTSAFWSAEEGGYSWRSDDACVTAHVLRALIAARPTSRSITAAVRWLMAARRGKAWDSTRTSAEATMALAEFIETSKETNPEYTATALLDGSPVATLSGSTGALFAAPAVAMLTPAQLAGKQLLEISRKGPGALYYSITTTRVIPPPEGGPTARGIKVTRTYTVTSEDPSQAGIIHSGAQVRVTTELEADANYRYVLLEDPLPSGFEAAPVDDPGNRYAMASAWGDPQQNRYVRQEVRDDRVVFFLNDLPKGRTRLGYTLYAETPGSYQALPATASLMYFPEVRGNSGIVKAVVDERRP